MDKSKLEEMIDQGLTIRSIAESEGKSTGTINYWLNKFSLKTSLGQQRKVVSDLSADIDTTKLKICNVCLEPRRIKKDFYVKRGKPSSDCKKCHNSLTQKMYQENKDRYQNRNRKKRKERRDRFREVLIALKNNPCTDCGNVFHHCAMDFDHVRGKKSFEIARGDSFSAKSFRKELKKCDLVCSNCHRVRTHNRGYPRANSGS